eukprot:2766189-Amphidinium_carterae.1
MPLNFRNPDDNGEPVLIENLRQNNAVNVVSMVAFADDLMVPIANTDTRSLMKQLSTLMAVLSGTFARFQLRMNLGAQKTEACLHLNSKDSKSIMQHLKSQGHPDGADDTRKMHSVPLVPFDGGALRVVSSYEYLG